MAGRRATATYLNPCFGMQVGHTRQSPKAWREKDDVAVRERLSIEQMIVGYTRNGAHQLRMENQPGSIGVGKLADLVVLQDNLFDIDSDDVWKVKPGAVLMEGEVIQGALPERTQN